MSAEGALRDGIAAGDRLIETLRFQGSDGFVRLDRHLARLARSAETLGFAFRRAEAVAALEAVASQDGPLRVRLTLSPKGAAEVATHPFTPLPAHTTWRVGIAATRVHSADPLLRHKTTRRAIYERARAEIPPSQADEVLLLNERGELCEGTITNLFVDPGDGRPLLTPPLSCGLLPGVLRQELLDTGTAVEVVLMPADLAAAAALHVGNSLRGLIAARLDAEDTRRTATA
jgi:4-amino-4-deoxychorismate lyase